MGWKLKNDDEKVKAGGTPLMIRGDTSSPLEQIHIGGKNQPFDERWLQKLIYCHPSCLPMDQIEPGLQDVISVCMELKLPCGSLDNLFMTPDGDIIIVEVKLWRNPEMRRTVIAQALDYATDLFGMDYESLEKAVLKSDFNGQKPPTQLYDMFGDAEVLAEHDFVDAVNRNLKKGQIVVLVVGDGTNTNLENLVDGLQSHAGFHFTFALIELEVFRGEQANDEFLIIPRTLAKTYLIERAIIQIDDQRSQVSAAPTTSGAVAASARISITSQQFFDDMQARHPELPNKLKAFMDKLETLGIYIEFKKSLNIKWNPPSGKPINFGYVNRNGQLWTDAATWFVLEKGQKYLDQLAKAFDGEVIINDNGNRYVAINGKAPRVETIMDKFDDWYEVIKAYQETFYDDD